VKHHLVGRIDKALIKWRCADVLMTHISENSRAPARFLVDNVHLLPKGRVLDIAMGTGRNTIYLAGMGFEVEGVDISKEAVDVAVRSAQKQGVCIGAKVVDLEGGYRIQEGAYDVIICFYYLQRSLIPSIKNGLRSGGVLIYETYTVDQIRLGKPRNPDYLLKHYELLDMFREFKCLRYREGVFEGAKAIASMVAQKV
jgi:tellurite methyltransferase